MTKKKGLDLNAFDKANRFDVPDSHIDKENTKKNIDVNVEEETLSNVEAEKNSDLKDISYKDVYDDDSFDVHKKNKTTVAIYKVNHDRINVLNALDPNISKTDILNYIINDFFKKHSKEIQKDYSKYLKNRDKNLF